jgi:hypothetical protein
MKPVAPRRSGEESRSGSATRAQPAASSGRFPAVRMRRNRKTGWARRLVAVWREADKSEKSATHHKAIAWRTAAENARRALSEVSRRPAALPGHAPARDHAMTCRSAQGMAQSKVAAD